MSVDSRVTTMKFDNAQFERGAAQTLSTLDKLKQKLGMETASKGLQNVQKTVDKFHMRPMETSITGVSNGFLALGTVAVTVLSRITNSALEAGKNLVRNMFGPIRAGLKEYETNLNSIQTILANTGLKGQKGLDKVNAALDELNHYSDQTIYNFSEMARNIGTFTAAGVNLKPATAAIKGIANLAAVSGSNSQQASTAMYQLSQALAAGRVSLMDWNSVVNAGMGGEVFQNALKETARVHGVAVDTIIKDAGSFRASISKGWISSDILTETLAKFTGDLSKAQLRQMGYNKKQIADIIEMGQTATDAATKVKTFSQLVSTLQETAGSGWAQTWELIIGDFGEARTLWTGVNDVLGGFISRSAEARNKVIGDWKALGGRTVLIEGLSNAFNALMDIVEPIRDAFRDIFPATTGKTLYDMTVAFRNFTEGLSVGKPAADALGRTFKGIFAILDIGSEIIKGILSGFLQTFGIMGGGSGGVLELTASFGDLLVSLRNWLVEGDKIGAFFDRLHAAKENVLGPVIDLFSKLVSAVAALVSGGFDAFADSLSASFGAIGPVIQGVSENLSNIANNIKSVFSRLDLDGIFDGFADGAGSAAEGLGLLTAAFDKTSDATQSAGDGVSKVAEIFKAIGSFLAGIGRGIANAFDVVKEKLGAFFEGLGIEDTLAVINTGFLIALYISFRKFLGKMGNVMDGISDTFNSASGVLDQVTSNLKSMQTEVRANAILKIAIALGLLAASLLVLSQLDTAALARGLSAVAALLTVLVGALIAMEKKIGGMLGTASKMVVLSVAMIGMSVAVLALAGAVALLSKIKTEDLMKGIGAVAAILGVVIGAALALERTGGAQQLVVAAAGILILAAALMALAGAMKLYASLDLAMLAEGGAKAAGAIIAIGIAMRAMPKNMLATSAGLFIVANSLIVLAGALKIMGGMSIEEIGKSIGVLAYSLGLIAIALSAMTGTASGAASLLIFAGALAILVPALIALSKLSVKELAIGLGALTAVFVILGAAAYALAPLAPVILALAGGIALLGLAVALVGGGLLAFSIGLATLAASGAAGIAVLTAAIIAVAQLFPLLMHQFGLGIRALAVVISKSGPELVGALSTVLGSLIKAVIENTPKLGRMITKLLDEVLRIIVDATPKIQLAAINMIISLMEGVRDNIGRFARTARQMMEAWMGAMAKEIPKLADSALEFIVEFINGIADAIEDNTAALLTAGGNLATAVIQGIIKGLSGGIGDVADAAKDVAKGALDSAMDFLGIKSPSKEFEKLGRFVDQGFAKGIVGGLPDVQESLDKMKTMIRAAMDASKAEVDERKSELEELKKNPKKNADEIEKVTKALARAERQYERSKDARTAYNKELADEQKQLKGLGRQYEEIQTRLDDANEKLKEAINAQTSYRENVTSQYARMPSITQLISEANTAKADAIKAAAEADKAEIDLVANALPEIERRTSLARYKEKLTQQTEETDRFLQSLNQLRNMGLDDASYKKLLKEGPGIQPIIDEMIASGPQGVAEIDAMTASLGAAASKLHALTNPEAVAATVAAGDPLAVYQTQLQNEAAANERFLQSLAQLRSMGLDEASYEKFVNEGVTIQPFIDSLIASGPQGVAELDRLTQNLKTSAENLGATAATELHEAGINSIRSLVTSIESEQSTVVAAMDRLGRKMIRALKKRLKIKSPSRIMEEIGKFTDKGLAKGLDKHADLVSRSATGVADNAVDSIKSTLEKVSASVNTSLSTDPVVKPVLDLSQMTRDVSFMNKMLDKQLVAEASYGQAMSISNEQAARVAEQALAETNEPASIIQFEQNNYSPKALSPVDVYRDTKNVLSLAKEALKNT